MPISQKLSKLIRSLHLKKFRDQNELFIAEGEKLCSELLKSDYMPEMVILRDSPTPEIEALAAEFSEMNIPVYTSPKNQFDILTDTKTPQGILAVVNYHNDEIIPDGPFIALDGISDPGNVGTIIRTADWFGVKQIILGRDSADKYNPKAVRSTMGSLFRCSVVSHYDLASLIEENFPEHQIFGATLKAEAILGQIKHSEKYGLVFGSESHGITKEVLSIVTNEFKINGFGSAESLNVAIAAGISLYQFVNE